MDSETSPAEPDEEPDAGQQALDALTKLAEQVRTSAKWLVASFAAVGALLVPGLQLANLGALSGDALAAALIAASVASAGAIFAAVTVARVLAVSRPSLSELVERETKAEKHDALIALVKANPTLLEKQASSLKDLRKAYGAAVEERETAYRELATASGSQKTELESRLNVAENRVSLISNVVDTVGAVADFQDVRSEFLRRRIPVAIATVIVAAAIGWFALAVHTESHATSDFSNANLAALDLSGANLDEADLHDSTLDRVDLHETSLRDADLSGAHLTGVNLTGADTRGVNTDGVVLKRSTCVDGKPSARRRRQLCFKPRRLPPPTASRAGGPHGTG